MKEIEIKYMTFVLSEISKNKIRTYFSQQRRKEFYFILHLIVSQKYLT